MGNPSRLEQQRRRDQLQWDQELRRRREQSTRDRERYQRQQQALRARVFHHAVVNVSHHSTNKIFPTLPSRAETMPTTVPWKEDSGSGKAFDSSFNNKKYSDVTVYLGESKTPFPAHQLILGMCSPYFDDALESGFKESITHEFTFEKDSPQAMWRVLQFMYTGDYADEPSDTLHLECDDLELLRHPRVFALADMFRMEDLKSLSCKKFELQLQQYWISDTLIDCIREVYSTSLAPSNIRKAVVKIVCLHKKALIQKRPFQELIREAGDFAVDLVLGMALDD